MITHHRNKQRVTNGGGDHVPPLRAATIIDMEGRLYAGTSGFAYASWKPDFYPQKLASTKFLEHYASRLNSTEINYTFRRLPTAKTLEQWVAATPASFVFALKAHMRLTHILRLKNCEQFLEAFFSAIDPLRTARRLGPVLFQLPPAMKCDTAVLDEFTALLPGDIRATFEFRNASWYVPEVYAVLEKRGIALCLAESEKIVTPEVMTARFLYFRLRKPDYTADDRREIAAKVEQFRSEGRDVFVYFKHEESAAGALYAEELLQTRGQPAKQTA